MAPEVIMKNRYNKSIDWWAVGIILYELLIGICPFYSKDKNRLMNKIQKQKLIFPNRNIYKIEYTDDLQDLIT